MIKTKKLKKILAGTLLALVMIAASVYAVDPMYIGVGARPLGMGKAYVGVAEDADAVFMNPAGLAGITDVKFSSMYTTLMDDIRYVVIGGAYPLEGAEGVLGGGLISTNVSDIPLYSNLATPEGLSNFGSTVMFVSYSVDLGKLKNYGDISKDFKDISVGGTLKYYSRGASNVQGIADGSGFDMDLSALYRYKPYMTFGANLQNFMGPSMNYASGAVDDIPGILKLGTKVGILGDKKKGKAMYQSEYRLDGALDYDISLTEKQSAIFHMGMEFQFAELEMLTLRGGIDQNPAPGGAQNNLTLGVGLDYDGMQFNYAYHPYGEIPGTSTHFFSICYLGVEKVPPKPKLKPKTSSL